MAVHLLGDWIRCKWKCQVAALRLSNEQLRRSSRPLPDEYSTSSGHVSRLVFHQQPWPTFTCRHLVVWHCSANGPYRHHSIRLLPDSPVHSPAVCIVGIRGIGGPWATVQPFSLVETPPAAFSKIFEIGFRAIQQLISCGSVTHWSVECATLCVEMLDRRCK